MPDLTDNLEHHLAPTEDAIRHAVTNGLLVVDTNVLLEGYRFNPDSRRELFSVLERVGDRLWIPHQVASEFLRRRVEVMFGLDSTYREVIAEVETFKVQAERELAKRIRNLANRVAMPAAERDQIIDLTTASLKKAVVELQRHQAAHGGDLTSPASDPVLDELKRIFAGKVGAQPSEGEMSELIAEAVRRAEQKIPPGYRDASKEDGSGDYIIWSQAIREARRRNLSLLFITRDSKDDWFVQINGRIVGARPELVKEASSAGVAAIVAQTRSLLFYARKHLHAPVSDETLRQAKPRQGSLRSRVLRELEGHVPAGDQRDYVELTTLVGDLLDLDDVERLTASNYVRTWKRRQASATDEALHQTKPPQASLRTQVRHLLDKHIPADDQRDVMALTMFVGDLLGLNDVDRLTASNYIRIWKREFDAGRRASLGASAN